MSQRLWALTWNAQNVTILLAVIATMTSSAVSDGEPRGLLADLSVLLLILVKLRGGILHALLLQF